MYKNQKGFTPIIIVLMVLFLVGVGGTSYYFINKQFQKQTACTAEAKICPDGSSVGRTGPNCEFAVCPEVGGTVIYKKDFDGSDLTGRLYKSEDNGKTWKEILKQYKGEIIYAIYSKNSNIIYAGDVKGNTMADNMDIDLYKSIDAGEHWVDISKGIVEQVDIFFGVDFLSVDSNNSNIINIAVSVGGAQKVNFKSSDGGITWTKLGSIEENIIIDGKETNISNLVISLPLDKDEAFSIANNFCNKEIKKDKGLEEIYGYTAELDNKWFINVKVVNCICGVLINKETGETNCFYNVPSEKLQQIKY